MIFPDYPTIGIVVSCLVLCVAGIYLFRQTRLSRIAVRVPTRLFSGVIVVCSISVLGMFGCASAFDVTTHSTPIYSPDHLSALRITDVDSGALGGYTWVGLYSHHGLIGRSIFSGDWKAAEPQTVRWLNDSEIVIGYHASYIHRPTCKSVNGISVKCEPVN
jgi:hypothetical protein